MYRRLPIHGDLPASENIMKPLLTVDEFNQLEPNLKRFYTYDTDGPAGPAPADKPAATEVLHEEYDGPDSPDNPVTEALNQSTTDYEKIKAPEGSKSGSDYDADLDSFLKLQEGNKAPDGTPTGTAGDIQTEQLRTDLEPGFDSYSPGKEETVSGSEVAAESAPLEVGKQPYPYEGEGTSEVNHEQMMAERKAAYEREQNQTAEAPVNQELIDQYNKTEAAQPSSPGPDAHEDTTAEQAERV